MDSSRREVSCPPTPTHDGLIAGDLQSENIHGSCGEITEHDSAFESSHDNQSDDKCDPEDVTRHETRAQTALSPEQRPNTPLN